MRVKSTWFKSGKEKTPEEIAGAVSFIAWKIALSALQNLRRADFEVGQKYFDILAEILVFLLLIADRIAFTRGAEFRNRFTLELFSRTVETYCENVSRIQNEDAAAAKQSFLDRFNSRSEDYAEFDYTDEGPDFAFTRYFAHRLDEIVEEKDKSWVIDRVLTIEVPEAVATISRAMKNLNSREGRARRAEKRLAAD